MLARLANAVLDPGWLFIAAGLALIACAVLIPAVDAADHVRWQRERALALERHRLERLRRHETFLHAVRRGENDLLRSLAQTQLHLAAGAPLVYTPDDLARRDASVFRHLEPPPIRLPARHTPDSFLYRLTTDPARRPWVIAAGTFCLLLGLLPPSRRARLPHAPSPAPGDPVP